MVSSVAPCCLCSCMPSHVLARCIPSCPVVSSFVTCCAAMPLSFGRDAACFPVLWWRDFVRHLLLLHAVRGYQVPSYVAAGINIWDHMVLIVIFKSHWKDSGGESIRSQWYLVHRGRWKTFVGPGRSSCETLWLFPVPCGMVLHLLLPPYDIRSSILTSQLCLVKCLDADSSWRRYFRAWTIPEETLME